MVQSQGRLTHPPPPSILYRGFSLTLPVLVFPPGLPASSLSSAPGVATQRDTSLAEINLFQRCRGWEGRGGRRVTLPTSSSLVPPRLPRLALAPEESCWASSTICASVACVYVCLFLCVFRRFKGFCLYSSPVNLIHGEMRKREE